MTDKLFPESYHQGYEEALKEIKGASREKLITLRTIYFSSQRGVIDSNEHYFWLGKIRAIDYALLLKSMNRGRELETLTRERDEALALLKRSDEQGTKAVTGWQQAIRERDEARETARSLFEFVQTGPIPMIEAATATMIRIHPWLTEKT